MLAAQRSAFLAREVHQYTLGSTRGFMRTATKLQEAAAAAGPSSSLSASPQGNLNDLRKRLSDYQGQNRRDTGNSGSQTPRDRRTQGDRGARTSGQGDNRGPWKNGQGERNTRASGQGYNRTPRRDGQGGGGNRSGTQRQGQRSGGGGGGQARNSRTPVRSNREWDPALTSAPVQSIKSTTNWQQGVGTAALGVCRVPYTIPTSTLESLRQGIQTKKYRPLVEARKNLKLHLVSGKSGSVMGPVGNPLPTARPRRREDDAPVPAKAKEGDSITQAAKETRVKFVQEKFGGDYQRWEREALKKATSSSGKKLGPIQGHATVALTLNDDLGPSTKSWTLDTVKRIASGTQ